MPIHVDVLGTAAFDAVVVSGGMFVLDVVVVVDVAW